MGFWDALVVIFLIAAVVWLRAQKYRKVGGKAPSSIAREPEIDREVEELRKRIAVLERIATDDRNEAELARKIESLRD
ncbi:hypothetical protein B2G71_01915 [Novosphingobium sp. PC22D]|uniref:hypothetical protein n=1 Tax=Novosphingobium sp. PC22D TaxID=1962403 RepID=UPI000BF14035|nr:hypothetical protein [Novosphingobium sp. PC22D]PEQ14378.1 hypothetical protein B2G71_01915 [Novosphingobium sp. PC22D]